MQPNSSSLHITGRWEAIYTIVWEISWIMKIALGNKKIMFFTNIEYKNIDFKQK